jgi:DNA primase
MVDGGIPEHAASTGWISIPYLTRLGGVVQLKFRRLSGDGPKYLGSGGQPRIYNTMALDLADQLGYVAICEGEFDALILDAYCGIPAVGIPGVDTWASRPEWREIFAGYSRVLVFADPDEPGQKLASRVLRDLDTAHLVALPGADVNETYLAKGADYIREAAGVEALRKSGLPALWDELFPSGLQSEMV